MSTPLGNPFVTYNVDTKKFEPYAIIGFNNLLLNTELTCPGDNTKHFIADDGIMTVEENSLAISKRALKVSPRYEEQSPTLSWTSTIGTSNINSIDIDNSKNIYIGSNDKTAKKINSLGKSVWSYTASDKVILVKADIHTKEVYILSNDKKLRKLSASGTLVWEYSGFTNIPKEMEFDYTNKLLYVLDGTTVKIINTSGTSAQLKNSVSISCVSLSDIRIDSLGCIYLLLDGYIRKYNNKFGLIWEFRCIEDGVTIRSFSIDKDSNVFITSTDKQIRKLSSSGVNQWQYSSNGYIPTHCAADKMGYVYVSSSDKTIIKFDSNGNKVWTLTTTNIPTTILVDDDKGFYYLDNTAHTILKVITHSTLYKSKVYQKVSLRPSTIYTLSFLYKSHDDGVLTAMVADTAFNVTIGKEDGYKSYTFCFKTPSSIDTTLEYEVSFAMNIATPMYLSDMKLEEGNTNTTWSASTKDERIRYESHGKQTIYDVDGVHGIRYNKEDKVLELGDGTDWQKIKTGGGSGGIVTGGTDYFSNASVVDSTAEYKVVQVKSSTTGDCPFFEAVVQDLILGRYSCMFRLKSDNISITSPIIKIEVFHRLGSVDTKLVEANIRGTDFDIANTWKTMGFVVDFHGNNSTDKLMVIKATLLKQTQSFTASLDYVITNFVYTNVGAIQTIKY